MDPQQCMAMLKVDSGKKISLKFNPRSLSGWDESSLPFKATTPRIEIKRLNKHEADKTPMKPILSPITHTTMSVQTKSIPTTFSVEQALREKSLETPLDMVIGKHQKVSIFTKAVTRYERYSKQLGGLDRESYSRNHANPKRKCNIWHRRAAGSVEEYLSRTRIPYQSVRYSSKERHRSVFH